MSEKTDLFDERYFQALQRQLEGTRRVGTARGTALGRAAFAEGLSAATIVRAHSRALARLLPAASGVLMFQRSESFLSAVLRPVEAGVAALRGTGGRERSLATSLRATTGRLAAVRRGLRRERTNSGRIDAELAQAVVLQRQLLAQARTSEEELRRMTRRALSVQEEERKRISRELHDEIAQVLAGINVHLAALRLSLDARDRKLSRRIDKTQRFLERSLAAVHRFARELRPALLDDLGLVPALRSFIRALPGPLEVRLAADPQADGLDGTKRTVLFRVAQEAITNAARHAQARRVPLRVSRNSVGVELRVRDNGRGFHPRQVLAASAGRHLGLVGMRERVEMVGGVFALESAPGKGTLVRATVPVGRRGKARTP